MRAAVGAAHVVDNADLHGRVDFVDSKIPKDYEVLLRPHQLHSSPVGLVQSVVSADRPIDRTQPQQLTVANAYQRIIDRQSRLGLCFRRRRRWSGTLGYAP